MCVRLLCLHSGNAACMLSRLNLVLEPSQTPGPMINLGLLQAFQCCAILRTAWGQAGCLHSKTTHSVCYRLPTLLREALILSSLHVAHVCPVGRKMAHPSTEKCSAASGFAFDMQASLIPPPKPNTLNAWNRSIVSNIHKNDKDGCS